MDIDAKLYHRICVAETKDGKNFVNKIRSDMPQKQIDNRSIKLCLDIGCGPGNVTKIVADTLNCDMLVGVDIDPNMIAFAKQNYLAKNIAYVRQDFGAPWESLAPQVRQLEGRVDIVYSSHTLQWITRRDNVADNIRRLLAPGARAYLSYAGEPYYKDLVTNGFVRAIFWLLVWVGWLRSEPEHEQRAQYARAFEKGGLKIVSHERYDGSHK
ncbi:unnamed protein product [Oppiella nova]|uniref:Methyltransferase type 11 domain-containing protein n=1 Tax=Oppiella nova TaxID=334625 RepID=A0A7R9M2Z7_9ACAR|nr:unnamed protein product [Oppiella nova]CAG2169608.1 unnamed protein product [Oppiella nova]